MRAGQRGPQHSVDHEQVWVVLGGELRVEFDERNLTGRAGDTLRLDAHVTRRVSAVSDMRALVASPATPTVTTDRGAQPLPWAA